MSYFKPATKEKATVEHTNIEVMVDLETLGITPTAPIVTIGAVLFDPRQQNSVEELRERSLLLRVDLADALNHSGGVDPDTLKWWFGQDDAAIKALVDGTRLTLGAALREFTLYCTHRDKGNEAFPGHAAMPRACRIWAKSPDFDCKILEHGFSRCRMEMPFKFWQYRCVRTLQDLAWPEGPDSRPKFNVGVAHDARHDAIEQALTVQAGFHQLGLS